MPSLWVALVLLAALIFSKRRNLFLWLGCLLFLVFTNAFLLNEVNRFWEPPATTEAPQAQVAVLLGGFSRMDTTNQHLTFTHTADRFVQALHLLQSGQVNRLIISSGSGYVNAPELRESIFVRQFMLDQGIDPSLIVIDSNSRNTHENALETAKILKSMGVDEPVVLVTSAFHMRRAKACFERAGIRCLPYATDNSVMPRSFYPEAWLLPQANVMAHWQVLLHEWAGFVTYKLMGYC